MATVRVWQPNVPFTPASKAFDAEKNASAAIVESRMLDGRAWLRLVEAREEDFIF